VAAGQVELYPQNPPRNQQPAGGGVYTTIRIERAADVAGAPGAFAEIGTVPIDTGEEWTYYLDQNGDSTAWYQYRYSNLANNIQSAYANYIQAGDSVVRQSVRSEIPDLDITVAMWDRWGREVMIDLFVEGIWKPDEGQIVITSTANVPDESYALPSHLRDLIAIETRDSSGRHSATLEVGPSRDEGDYQLGPTNRRVRIFDPSTSTSTTYWAIGKAQYRNLGELTDDFFTLAMHMLLVKYAMFRQHQRLNWKKFITFDPTTDILPRDLAGFIQQEKIEVATRVSRLALPEPPLPLPY